QEALPVLDRHVVEGRDRVEMVIGTDAAHADAGIVHQHVDAVESLRHPTDGLSATLDLGEVDSEGQQAVFAGLPPKIVHERLQSVFGDVYEGDPKAFADERARDYPTETTGRAGDDCHFAHRHLSLGCLAQDLLREAV